MSLLVFIWLVVDFHVLPDDVSIEVPSSPGPIPACSTGWVRLRTSPSDTAHDTVLLGADDENTGAAAGSAAALVVVSAADDELA